MTQYNELIIRKAKELEAEEWGNQVKYIHASNGVMEIAYNNGLKRETKDSLFTSFGKWIADQRGK